MTDLHQPGDPPRADISPRVAAAVRQDLARVDELWRRLDVVVLTPPAEGSAAQQELGQPLRAYAHDHASTALRAALDHLRAWRNLFTAGEVPMYAHLSLLRTAHESALFAYWLAEPGIDADTRRARGVAAHADDQDERRKCEKAMELAKPALPAKLAVDRLAELMAAAAQCGLVGPNKKGDPVLTTTAPAAVELFDMYETVRPPAKPQSIYRWYSGYAHAKQWALMMGAEPQAPFDSSGRTIALSQASDMAALASTRRTVDAVDRALSAFERLRK